MQRYNILFFAVNALHASDGFSAHHQELKIQNCTVLNFELLVMGGETVRNT
jgi:hypothetical protein